MIIDDYFGEVRAIVAHIEGTQGEVIARAAEWIADSMRRGGMLHVFGAGHSSLIAAEMFYRAGGLVPVNPITDPNLNVLIASPSKGSQCEKMPGYGTMVLDAYRLEPGEVMIVVSQSGKNVTPVEVALEAQKRDLRVVAITSLAHANSVPAAHASGKKLHEVADLVIDSGTPVGDAAVTIRPEYPRVAPMSSIAGMIIANAIAVQVAAAFAEQGQRPPLWVSQNVPNGQATNAEAASSEGMYRYSSRLKVA